jgi:hypothetical protein
MNLADNQLNGTLPATWTGIVNLMNMCACRQAACTCHASSLDRKT